MRLIDADALQRHKQLEAFGNGQYEDVEIVYGNDIDNATVIEIIQCKDCKWWTKQKASAQGRCELSGAYPTGGLYCANGRRKDDDTD